MRALSRPSASTAAPRRAGAAPRRSRLAPAPAAAANDGAAASSNDASGGGGSALDNVVAAQRAHNFTMAAIYNGTAERVGPQIDHHSRRRERVDAEVVEAGRKRGLPEPAVRAGLASLVELLPALAPNLDRMRASDWAVLATDVNGVMAQLIALKTAFPTADVGRIVAAAPRLLLRGEAALKADAAQARRPAARRLLPRARVPNPSAGPPRADTR
jgi:hypothetical protein